jgi:16S rRNA A1518/A1519 N6-dimethyltransferase RsmA/KsgA/DIM1 with predicted DNA glycosylase/AP lyase activity
MFNEMEIKIANATSRSGGASAINKDGSIRAIVPKYVSEYINKEDSVLDFGAGKGAVHTKWLREEGFNVTAYDFGDNIVGGLHDKNALQKQYKVIMASNVLNVQSSLGMLFETLRQIDNSLEQGGEFICNYPASPRKMVLTANDLREILQSIFKGRIERVGGTSSAPLWKVQKAYIN